MRAILYDPSAPHGLRLDEAPDPKPGEHEALLGAAVTPHVEDIFTMPVDLEPRRSTIGCHIQSE